MSTEKGKTEFSTQLTKVSQAYLPLITQQLENNNVTFSEYGKTCVLHAISAINNALEAGGTSWNDKSLDQSNISQILLNVATLQLNATAQPSEVFFMTRNVQNKQTKEWGKKIEMTIQGDGWDSLLSRFGRNVKTVHRFWEVREDDDFTYPTFNGLEMTPPQWSPKGTGKCVRVVYPIQNIDNSVDFYIAERKDVKKNLLAHISNNLQTITFGLAKDKYSATDEQKKKIAEKKAEILEKAKSLELDDILDCKELEEYISPAWKEPQARESMIIRKMRNNIVRKIPKNFASAFESEIYNENTDESYKAYNEEYVTVEEEELEPIALGDGTMVDKETGEIKGQPEF